MRTDWRKLGAAVVTFGLAESVILTGCGSGSTGTETEVQDKVESSAVTTITVGSGSSYSPYCYLDDNGNAVGYEYDVLNAIDEKLPQYEFKYESMDFDNLLLSLDSGKVDMVAHQYEATDERKEKYLFANESYTTYNTYITVLSSVNDISSLDDLQGKKIWGQGTTSATNQILVKYNSEHKDNPIELVNNNDTSAEYQITSLQEGAWAATIAQERDVAGWNEEYGEEILKTVGEPINSSLTYYLYNKDETQLRDDVDAALKELKEDGTLKELSEKWLGGDYTGE
jgi:L-cystine transport system substrate-binding protein